ncbi:MAG: class I SAM-dependent DNA methyltransferase [Candidatus Brocadia sp.]
MRAFDNYASYYDLLYRDKDYKAETYFINRLIREYMPHSKSILDLGCGTGYHAFFLAQEGYVLHGVDSSERMIMEAQRKCNNLPKELANHLSFSLGDIRTLRLDKTFDVVVSLFHAINYQTKNKDLKATFSTVKEHLNPDGIFIFDSWYGPAVLTEKPAVRIKRIEDGRLQVTRIASPTLCPNENCVNIDYHFFIRDKITQNIEEFKECHKLRYLFLPEIIEFFANAGMKMILSQEWMTTHKPGINTWNVCFVGSKL